MVSIVLYHVVLRHCVLKVNIASEPSPHASHRITTRTVPVHYPDSEHSMLRYWYILNPPPKLWRRRGILHTILIHSLTRVSVFNIARTS